MQSGQLSRLLSLLLSVVGMFSGSLHVFAQDTRPETRAIWVTRGEYRTADDIREIMRNCARLNLNVILFQIRGNGTAFYNSPFEPWADELGGKDPGFDPLAVAVEESHRAGLELHAYVNVMPGWRGKVPPTSSIQLYRNHLDWFAVDSLGRHEPLTDTYVTLSPGIPEVQDYLAAICVDLAKRYSVDGIHLDYIRYLGAGYSYDKPSVNRFVSSYGKTPLELPESWNQFRRDQVTEVVRKISHGAKAVKPNLRISVAALRVYSRAYSLYFQDVRAWLKEGLVDDEYNMLYVADSSQFSTILQDGLQHASGRKVFPGIGVRNLSPVQLTDEILITRRLGAKGFALFSYGALFPVSFRRGNRSEPEGNRFEELQRALLEGPFKEKVRPAW